MKRILALLSVITALSFALPAQATVMGVYPGDLIKLKDDKNPATLEDKVVYYFDKEWQRRPFPNQKVFNSWYENFEGVKELTKQEMAEIRLGSPIIYRPGTRLIKIPSIPKVYAVEPNGSIRWLETESVAKALYGNDWSKRVDDVSETFFMNYKEGAPLTVPVWPTGTVLKRKSDGAAYLVDGLSKRPISGVVASTLRLQDSFVIAADDAALSAYADSGAVAVWESKIVDSSQISYVDTLAPPGIDFPANVDPLKPGTVQPLAVLRITSGMPAILRAVSVTVSGPLWNGATPNLSDLQFIDANGMDMFGIKQLEAAGASSEKLAFNGAFTMNANTTAIVQLRAKSAAGLPKGTKFTIAIDRESIRFADGTNGNLLPDFYPRTAFPTTTLEVK